MYGEKRVAQFMLGLSDSKVADQYIIDNHDILIDKV